jgi:non-ribosomal peptide synthetase component E (peptide arylation enzyme)
MSLAEDREELKARWYRDGYFTNETLADHIASATRRFPSTTMTFVGTERTVVADLATIDRRSTAVAAGLVKLGLRPGDVIGVQVPNWVESAIAYEAAMKLGLIIVPIIHIYGPSEVGFILRQSKARALIVPDQWRHIDYLERVAALSDLPDLEHIVVIGERLPAGAKTWASVEAEDPSGFEVHKG